jgi:hypothetical protein
MMTFLSVLFGDCGSMAARMSDKGDACLTPVQAGGDFVKVSHACHPTH